MEKRTDKPLCPYCKKELALWASTGQMSNEPSKVQGIEDPKYKLKYISLYCTSSECVGISTTNQKTGYDIVIKDI